MLRCIHIATIVYIERNFHHHHHHQLFNLVFFLLFRALFFHFYFIFFFFLEALIWFLSYEDILFATCESNVHDGILFWIYMKFVCNLMRMYWYLSVVNFFFRRLSTARLSSASFFFIPINGMRESQQRCIEIVPIVQIFPFFSHTHRKVTSLKCRTTRARAYSMWHMEIGALREKEKEDWKRM